VIGRLTGTLVESKPDRVLLDVHGVGYELSIPLGTFSTLPPTGERVTLQVKTHMREDAIQLFGFATAQEKYVFERLLSVSGIGPRVALTVLSGLPLPELVSSIATSNAKRLTSIPGIGKKLAERLALELKEKMAEFGKVSPREELPRTTAAEDAIGALLNLGYKQTQAEAAVVAAAKAVSPEDLNALLQAALKSLAK